MSYSHYDQIKQQIKDAIDIVELVSRYVTLGRQGRNFVGRCPWHDDSRPSLIVNPERQSYKCWVCNVGGDIFSFIMQMEKVDFREAFEILAEITGVAIEKPAPKSRKQSGTKKVNQDSGDLESLNYELQDEFEEEPAPEQQIDKRTLFNTMDWVQKQYHEALFNLSEAENARAYLKDRGFSEQTIREFQIGYASLERDWLLKKVGNSPRRIECLEKIGVLAKYEDEESKQTRIYDRFRGRLMFPIRDTQDRAIAFGGRLLPNTALKSSAKYVNSPETPLFQKSKQLYGLDVARLTMRNSRRALIMEGYTDCIMAHQVGIKGAVAILGTALGSEHIRILKRFVDKMVLVLDGDEAGQKRANEVLELFIAQGINMTMLTLPANLDPCEFLLEQGKEKFDELLNTYGIDPLEHAFRNATKNVDLEKDIVGSSNALDKLLSIIAAAPTNLGGVDDPVQLRLEKMIARLAERFRIAEPEVRKRLSQWRDRKSQTKTYGDVVDYEVVEDPNTATAPIWSKPESAPDSLERILLELWFADPTTFEDLDNMIPDEWIQSPFARHIQTVWREIQAEEGKSCSFDRLLVRFDDPAIKSTLVEMDESASDKGLGPGMDAEKRQLFMAEIVQGFTRRDVNRRKPKDLSDLKSDSLSKEEKQRKLQEILNRKRGN